MLQIGAMAPDFALTADDGQTVRLSDLRGQAVVIFFYPGAFTPGCTRQACGFRDNFPRIEAAGATVLGVSPDSPEKLARWREAENLPYRLLSDPDHAVAEAYGAYGERTNYGRTYMGIIRSHVVVDPQGKLVDVQNKISPEKSVAQALEQLSTPA